MNQPTNDPGTPKEMLRAMQILCAALMLGVVFFALIILVLNLTSGPTLGEKEQSFKKILLYINAAMGVICFFFANKAYRETAIVKNLTSLTGKLNQYRAILIKYMALCEAPALFSIIAFFLSGEYLLLMITGVMLAAMFSKMPFKSKVISELTIDWKEQEEL